jgi:hypothetical protein
MSLSWKYGKPIARVEGGKYAKRILYINSDPQSLICPSVDDMPYIITEKWIKSKKKSISSKDIDRIYRALVKGIEPDDDILGKIYLEAKEIIKKSGETEVNLLSGRFVPIPVKENRKEKNIAKRQPSRLYCAGPSESGKSHFAAQYIREIMNGHKKDIYMFSEIEEDEVLDKLGLKRIKLDESLIDNPVQLDELKNSIAIFDDIDTILDKKLQNAVCNLRDRCLSKGSHFNISTICTNHAFCDHKATSTMLLEAKLVTFFPQAGGISGIKRFLKEYCGLDLKMIKRILALPSRWVAFHKGFPQYCIYETGCFLINKPLMDQKLENIPEEPVRLTELDDYMYKESDYIDPSEEDDNYFTECSDEYYSN